MVGDAWSDLLAGQWAGVQGTIMVRTGRGSGQLKEAPPPGTGPFLVSDNLFEAFKTITEKTENRLTSSNSSQEV
jgi:phosphoglycolate phosphatase-like HAD superfamily hydrolase